MQLRYWTVDGAIYAQPLYMPDVVVNGSIVNLVFAATEHSSVYAFNSGGHFPAAVLKSLDKRRCGRLLHKI